MVYDRWSRYWSEAGLEFIGNKLEGIVMESANMYQPYVRLNGKKLMHGLIYEKIEQSYIS